jgi:hypothetical protein
MVKIPQPDPPNDAKDAETLAEAPVALGSVFDDPAACCRIGQIIGQSMNAPAHRKVKSRRGAVKDRP